MQALLTLLSLIMLVNFSHCFVDPHGPQSNNQIRDDSPLPENYTRKNTFKLQYKPRSITYSPDENWIVYCSNENSFPNKVFFRNRSSFTDESSVQIGQSQKNESITTFAFSKSGNLLFVGTETNNLFVCKFSGNMKDDDCLKSYFLGDFKGIQDMATNSYNKMFAASSGNLWLLNFTSDGDLSLQFHMLFKNVFLYPLWHPKAEEDTLVFGGFNYTCSDSLITVLNITTQSMNNLTLKNTTVSHMKILKDRQTLLVTEGSNIGQYNLSLTSVIRIGSVTTIVQDIFKISEDGRIAVGNSPGRIAVYSLQQQQAQSSNFSTDNDRRTESTINLKQLFYIEVKIMPSWFAISSDANELLLEDPDYPEINQYSLCLNNTYFSNMQCLDCSLQCKTCHVNANLCFDCINNSYVLNNSACLKCNAVLDGCLTCSDSSFCLTCDTSAGFVKTPVNGLCQCSDFNYVKEGYCVPCDGKSICRRCSSPTNCLICNKINFWQETPINGTCVCQDFYFNASSTCTLCDSLRVCRTCDNSSYCTKCDTSKGFLEDPVNGNCVCPSSFTLNSGKCIACQIERCSQCLSENICYQCESGSSLSDGNCVSESTSMILIFVGVGLVVILGGVFVYCKCKHMKKKSLEESLITSGKEKQTTEGATINSERENQNKAHRSIGPKLITENAEIEPHFNQERAALRANQARKGKPQIYGEEEEDEDDDNDDDGEPSFIRKYKKLMQKSDVEDGSDLNSRIRQGQRKIEQKAPPKQSRVQKNVKQKAQPQSDRQVKKIMPKDKVNIESSKQRYFQPQTIETETKLDDYEYDESQQTYKAEIRQEKGSFNKKSQAISKHQKIPEPPFEEKMSEHKPEVKSVKAKAKKELHPKEEKPNLKQQKSRVNKLEYGFNEESKEQKPDFSQSSLKKGPSSRLSQSQQNKLKETAGLNDIEQAAYNQLTDEEKMMLKMVRGSFGER